MANAGAAVNVRGLGELQRDFKRMSKDLDKDLVKKLKEAADPVRSTAEQLAMTEITNMTSHWSRMRIGVTAARDLLYMVPRSRGRKRKRPNLSGELFREAMDPALKQNEDRVIGEIDKYLGQLGSEYGF